VVDELEGVIVTVEGVIVTVTVICGFADTEVAAGDVSVSVLVVPEDVTGKELFRDVALFMVTVGTTNEVVGVGGMVIGGRVLQRASKSIRYGSNRPAKIGCNGITQFTHCWISVSLAGVQRQEIPVQDSYKVASGVHILAH